MHVGQPTILEEDGNGARTTLLQVYGLGLALEESLKHSSDHRFTQQTYIDADSARLFEELDTVVCHGLRMRE